MRDVVNRESGLFTSPDDNRRLLNLIRDDGKSLNRLCFVCIFVVNVSFFIALIPLSYIERHIIWRVFTKFSKNKTKNSSSQHLLKKYIQIQK